MRVTPEEYQRIDLRAHSLLESVPLHDVWAVDLVGGSRQRTMVELRALLSATSLAKTNLAVRFLFGLRRFLGRIFAWDHEAPGLSRESFVHRLSAAERAGSLVVPGTADGPFRVLYVSPHEAISEIQNATVHAFSVFALRETTSGHRFYWGIYVQPVGRITRWYMRLIDPFRRAIIYPAVLRRIQAAWSK